MTDISEQRKNIQIEECDYESSVSEATFMRVGAAINFINKRQHQVKEFFANGNYRATTGFEGLFVFPIAAEVIGVGISNNIKGTSGTTIFDVHWFSSPGVDEGSIFSQKPSIASTAPNYSYIATYEESIVGGGTGIVEPVISKKLFEAGDALRVDIESAMAGAENSALTIYWRPA